MKSMQQIIRTLNGYVDQFGVKHLPVDIDTYRHALLKAISEKTGRNVVTYYSGYLADKECNTIVNETDISGFIPVLHDLDPSKGVDVILHTPGGDPDAAEGIVKYFHQVFGTDVRAIIPQGAFSAGTMIACASKSILMGPYSCLGPIDPQIGGIPVSDMLQEMNCAKKDIRKDHKNIEFWKMRLGQYPAGYYFRLMDAIRYSTELVTESLLRYMFSEENPVEAVKKTKKIVQKLNSNNRSHGRHFSYEFCKALGLNVEPLEGELEELVLELHNLYTITFNCTYANKIIENQDGVQHITEERPVQEG